MKKSILILIVTTTILVMICMLNTASFNTIPVNSYDTSICRQHVVHDTNNTLSVDTFFQKTINIGLY